MISSKDTIVLFYQFEDRLSLKGNPITFEFPVEINEHLLIEYLLDTIPDLATFQRTKTDKNFHEGFELATKRIFDLYFKGYSCDFLEGDEEFMKWLYKRYEEQVHEESYTRR